jgi:hypothetical protein
MDRRAGLRTKRRPFATAAASRMSATAATAAAAAAMGSGLEPLHEHAARLGSCRRDLDAGRPRLRSRLVELAMPWERRV